MTLRGSEPNSRESLSLPPATFRYKGLTRHSSDKYAGKVNRICRETVALPPRRSYFLTPSTGLRPAARQLCKDTDNNETANIMTPAAANIHHSRLVL